jgi:hypothetical protein
LADLFSMSVKVMPIVTPETVDKQFILKCLDKDLCIFCLAK